MLATPPLDAEQAACPIWPSKAATVAVLTITPRTPSSFGSFSIMIGAASRMGLNVPTRLICTTFTKESRGWSPLLLTTFSAEPMPGVEGLLSALLVDHIGALEAGLLADTGGQLLTGLLVHVGDGDAGSFLRQPTHSSGAQARGAAGD